MIRMRLALVSAALTAALALSVCGGASIETFDVGNWPIAMAYDGEHLWIANQLDNTVSKLAVDGAILGTYPMPSPMDMVFDGEAIWATNGADGYRAPIVRPEEFEPLAGFTAPL